MKSERTAVYAGTFDPITNGHLDVVARAGKMFHTVVVAIAASTTKNTLFSVEERVNLAREAISALEGNFRVESFDGLLVEYVRNIKGNVIIRGLRAVSDYEYEAQMALFNRQLAEDIETVFLMTADKYSFITSSIIKQVAMYHGDISRFVPTNVLKKLNDIYPQK